MDIKFYLAIIAGKSVSFFLKKIGKGATAAPGLIALEIDPELILKISNKNNFKSIVISGTNGKTTTARLLSHFLQSKYKLIHNRQGSNLLRGIASTLLKDAEISGKTAHNIGVWEVDEAVLAGALVNLNVDTLILLNLFRDQLDRYGEINNIKQKWEKAISILGKKTTLILNADDPSIYHLKNFFQGKTIFFGVSDKQIDLPTISNVSDIKICPNCTNTLSYQSKLTSHLGAYYCKVCKFKRPKASVYIKNIKFTKNFGSQFKIFINNKPSDISLTIPGLFNIYDFTAAAAAAIKFKITEKSIAKKAKNFKPAFGRYEQLEIEGNKIIIFLIKNPTGANEVLRVIMGKQSLSLLLLLNDNIADGKDVSWIWDVSFESIVNKLKNCHFSGTRAYDIAVRLKYAKFNVNNKYIHEDINYSFSNFLSSANKYNTQVILCTYSAMLELQKILSIKYKTKPWHKS